MDQGGFSSRSMHHVTSPLCPSDHNDICSSLLSNEIPNSREAFFFQPLHSTLVGGIESYLDPKYIGDPSTFSSRLPFLPFSGNYPMCDWGFEPAFIRKRNERERQRVKCVNEGYARLREHLPQEYAEKRLSKVETLRAAIKYIKQLQSMLGIEDHSRKDGQILEPSNKMPVSPEDSEQDKLSEENFAKYLEEEEHLSMTPSSHGDHSSTPGVENEDSLVSSLSPRVKVEVPSPSEFIETAETSLALNRQRSPYDYHVKGKIFCATNQNGLKTQVFEQNWKPEVVGRSRGAQVVNCCIPNTINFQKATQNINSKLIHNEHELQTLGHTLGFMESTKTFPAATRPVSLPAHNACPYQRPYQQKIWRSEQAKQSGQLLGVNELSTPCSSNYGK